MFTGQTMIKESEVAMDVVGWGGGEFVHLMMMDSIPRFGEKRGGEGKKNDY